MLELWKDNKILAVVEKGSDVLTVNGVRLGSFDGEGSIFSSEGIVVGSYDKAGRVFDVNGHCVGSVRDAQAINLEGESQIVIKNRQTNAASAALLLLFLRDQGSPKPSHSTAPRKHPAAKTAAIPNPPKEFIEPPAPYPPPRIQQEPPARPSLHAHSSSRTAPIERGMKGRRYANAQSVDYGWWPAILLCFLGVIALATLVLMIATAYIYVPMIAVGLVACAIFARFAIKEAEDDAAEYDHTLVELVEILMSYRSVIPLSIGCALSVGFLLLYPQILAHYFIGIIASVIAMLVGAGLTWSLAVKLLQKLQQKVESDPSSIKMRMSKPLDWRQAKFIVWSVCAGMVLLDLGMLALSNQTRH